MSKSSPSLARNVHMSGGFGNWRKGSNASTQNGTSLLLKLPFGPALVIVVGLLVFGIAFFSFYATSLLPARCASLGEVHHLFSVLFGEPLLGPLPH